MDNNLPKTVETLVEQHKTDDLTPKNKPRPLAAWMTLVLLPILLIAGYFRYTGINWDQFTHLHPDERFLTMVADRLQSTDPLNYLSTTNSPLNPYNVRNGDGRQTFPLYVYGNLPMTATRVTAEALTSLCAQDGRCMFGETQIIPTSYNGIHIVGRLLSATVDMLSVAFLFFMGRRLYGWKVGALASLLLALAVLPIQQAHFFTADNWAAAFTTIALYFAVRASETGQKRWYTLFGIMLGGAVASRVNVAPLAMMAGVAGIIHISRYIGSWNNLLSDRGIDLLFKAAIGVGLAAVVSFATFRTTMPYAFQDRDLAVETIRLEREIDEARPVPRDEINKNSIGVWYETIFGLNPKWCCGEASNMTEIQRLQKPDAVFPPATQWVDRPAIVFPLTNMVLWGMGLLAGLSAVLGGAWATLRLAQAKPEWRAHMIPVVWSLFYFVFMGTRWVKSMRYFLPVYPTLLLLGAWALMELVRRSKRASTSVLAYATMMAVVMGSMLYANQFLKIYTEPMTRIQASDWFYDNIESGATLLYETEGGDSREFVLPLRNHTFQLNGTPLTLVFDMPEDGTIKGIRFNYLTDEGLDNDTSTFRVRLDDWGANAELAVSEGILNLEAPRSPAVITFPDNFASEGATLAIVTEMTEGSFLTADTARLMNEQWDDPLPVATGGRNPFGQYYAGVRDEQMGVDGTVPMPNADGEDKRQAFYRWLEGSDVVVLSSQRAVWSTPRIPMTYPLTMRYYEALFNGELGFEKVGEFHHTMNVGPLYFSDVGGNFAWGQPPEIGWPPPNDLTAAEEAFSVYDHPPVWVFKKTEDYSSAKVQEVLGAVDLSTFTFMNPGQATAAPTGLLMADEAVSLNQAGGTFSDMFNANTLVNANPVIAGILWWIALFLVGLVGYPLVSAVFEAMPSRGYALSRTISLLLISYIGWLGTSLGWLSNDRLAYVIGLLIVAGISVFLTFRDDFKAPKWSFVITTELVALGLFLLAMFIRLGNPDVWDVIWGGEKPMDLTYFTAVLKSSSFPPYDPWYAGGTLNYYYYGFVFVGVLTKLLGVLPAIAYNLIVPSLFALTGVGAFGVAYDLKWKVESGKWKADGDVREGNGAITAGLVAVALCVLLGNLGQVRTINKAYQAYRTNQMQADPERSEGIGQAVQDFVALIGPERAPIYPGDWFWDASRAINADDGEAAPITEFPFFTFLYGDLHAHMIALPLTLVALGWVIAFGLRDTTSGRNLWRELLRWGVGAIAIGVLFPTNSWDFPTYLVLGLLGVVLFNLRKYGTFSLPVIGQSLVQAIALGVLATAAFLPFRANFGAGFSEIAVWEGSHTNLQSYLTVWGLFLFLVVVHVGREALAWVNAEDENKSNRTLAIFGALIGGIALGAILWILRGVQVGVIALPLVLITGVISLTNQLNAPRRIIMALISSAFALTLFVDIFVIEGTVGRMNTVFKFYMQVWVILSVVGGVALASAWRGMDRWGDAGRIAYQTALILLVGTAALYPPLATKAKWDIRMSKEAPRTLDGMAFLQTATYSDNGTTIDLSQEYNGLIWMQDNVVGSPVVAEGYSSNYYRSISNRVAMYTGLPSIIGWKGHQEQQRAVLPNSRVQERVDDVNNLFNTLDVNEANRILDKYNVAYVYVGTLEKAYYSPDGLAKFDEMDARGDLSLEYRSGDISIYKRTSFVLGNNEAGY